MNIRTNNVPPAASVLVLAARNLPSAGLDAAEPQDVVTLSSEALQAPEGMEVVEESRLPESVGYTIDLIESGHRFHRRRNGITFHNNEGLLPQQPGGYYTEWTVRERGQSGRKKTRLVAGQAGELFLTTNHYKSFRWVVPSPN